MARLRINDDEEVLQVVGVSEGQNRIVVQFQVMRNTLTNLWHSLEGFFHRIDIDRVVKGAHWTFNNHLLVFHSLGDIEEPLLVPLVHSYFWVQVHDLPSKLYFKTVTKQLGNFIRVFEEYDLKQVTRGFKHFMRIRVRFDIKFPLKRRKIIQLSPQNHIYVRFQYEKLTLFCFLCGCLGHIKSVWLREGSVVGLVRNSLESRRVRLAKGFLVSKGMSNINTMLGMNLEGRLKKGIKRVTSSSTGFGQDPMIHYLEKNPNDGLDGNKRQKTIVFSGKVSETSNSGENVGE
ncbi:hypothetical protein CXB51_023189 [Gossypium anomalum]|uniref:Zinc knuckle CX2CX4HX4C domain-containing protein n=1 Tax=Gossypium anomalum TaxID=47600 RepID=A0A8J6CSY9_9ROSI|nr:hypothetical protein CXB51_023189 [Gossypium anomalum]